MTQNVKQQILDALYAEYDIPEAYERNVKRESLVYNFSFFPGADGAVCVMRSSVFEGSTPMPFMAKFHWNNTFDIDKNLSLLVEYLQTYTLLQSAQTEAEKTKISEPLKKIIDKLLDGFQLQGITISHYLEKASAELVIKNHHYYLFIKLLMNELDSSASHLFMMLISGIESAMQKRIHDEFVHKYDDIESMPMHEQPRMLTDLIPPKTGDLYFGIDANDLDFAQNSHKSIFTKLTNEAPVLPAYRQLDERNATLSEVLKHLQRRHKQKYAHNL